MKRLIKVFFPIILTSSVFAQNIEANWDQMINLLDECLRDLENNVNFTLSLYSLMINIQYCLKGNKQSTAQQELIKGI